MTTARLPDGIDIADLLKHPAGVEAGLTAGVGDVADRLIRLNHTGPRARRDIVLANVLALGHALNALGRNTDGAAAADAIAARYAGAG